MTIGFWRADAAEALRAAAAAMQPGRIVPAGDIYAVAVARGDVYTQLARVTGMLLGHPPIQDVPSRTVATDLLSAGPYPTRLYAGLRGAALLGQQYPPGPADPGEAATRLRRAADAVGVIGDVLASHVGPYHRPSTREGWQIRARGGVAGALADVALLAIEAITVDRALPGWLDAGGRRSEMDLHPLARSANWAVNSRLGAAAGAVIAAAADRPRLLDELDLSRQPLEQPAAVTTVDAAVTAVDTSRRWLWQHADQITLQHLQLVAQLGLAVHTVVDDPDSPLRSGWRRTAATLTQLRGIPPVDTARDVAGELRQVLQWLHEQRGQAASGDQRERLQPLATRLPALASTLHRGLDRALLARNVFVGETVLRRPDGSLIYRSVEQWRPATRRDDLVRDLSRALWRLADPESPTSMSATATGSSQGRGHTESPRTNRSSRPRR